MHMLQKFSNLDLNPMERSEEFYTHKYLNAHDINSLQRREVRN